jgi:hypothetical protein
MANARQESCRTSTIDDKERRISIVQQRNTTLSHVNDASGPDCRIVCCLDRLVTTVLALVPNGCILVHGHYLFVENEKKDKIW